MVKKKKNEPQKDAFVVALAGNPNVGKSTVFNALTGMHQHTGNWPGKTVSNAFGSYTYQNKAYTLVDLPGTYSLSAHSEEEKHADDFLFSLESDAVAVVCDATCLLRNLHLVLQIAELTPNTVVCVNLMDEAKHKGLSLDLDLLSKRLSLPVIPMAARSKKGLSELKDTLAHLAKAPNPSATRIPYPEVIEHAVGILENALESLPDLPLSPRALALQMLKNAKEAEKTLLSFSGVALAEAENVQKALLEVETALNKAGISKEQLREDMGEALVRAAESFMKGIVTEAPTKKKDFSRTADRIFMSKTVGIPVMLLLLLLVFWITIVGANYPSEMLSNLLFGMEEKLLAFFTYCGVSPWLRELLVFGLWRVLSWVVAVMLPPMAIFFPMFTLLEDLGYLPRVAFNLDHQFRKAGTCGKQSLTMCMGFGCNAVGVTGCRIIDSPRERLIAVLTNSLVPCNGRFPILISIITMFFLGASSGFSASLASSVLLTLTIVFSVLVTQLVSKILSKTILKGIPSSFTLELPPYRKPQIGKVIVRSIFDRTLFVLGRAVAVAAPAGILIWLLSNLSYGGETLLAHCAAFLDPFAHWLGLDGVILLAFILGLPANEIVFPIIIMAYLSAGSLLEFDSLTQLHALLIGNGWTIETAICVMLFALMHWPCSTTLLTIQKETKSFKWTALSFLIPTVCGLFSCFLVHLLFLGIHAIF